ncbi:MAG: hypothetical protein C0404_02580 [Verrucomicrobia bacterium]|nr:hypothetical protein [Verrucomicrobiota bacterium]
MKCKETEPLILLAESGELPAADREALEAHLKTCAQCAEYRLYVAGLTGLAKKALPAGEPSDLLVGRIMAEARSHAAPRVTSFRRPVLQILAYAAALAVAAGVWLMFKPAENGNGRAKRIDHARAIVAMVTDQEVKNGLPAATAGDHDRALKALADQLLRMEGLSVEPIDQDLSSYGIDPEA